MNNKCSFCGASLAHDVLRFQIVSPDGIVPACLDCAEEFLARHRRAHAEAGRLLEALWETE